MMFVTVGKLAGRYFGSFKMVPEEKKNTSSNYTEVIFLLMSNSVSGLDPSMDDDGIGQTLVRYCNLD